MVAAKKYVTLLVVFLIEFELWVALVSIELVKSVWMVLGAVFLGLVVFSRLWCAAMAFLPSSAWIIIGLEIMNSISVLKNGCLWCMA